MATEERTRELIKGLYDAVVNMDEELPRILACRYWMKALMLIMP